MNISFTREKSLHTAFASRSLAGRQRELARLQEQLSTGLRVNRASDDPTAFAEARQMERLGLRYEQHQRALDGARLWTNHTQDALDDLTGLFADASARGLQASSDALSPEGREAIAQSLEQLRDTVVDRLNARVGNDYLFAGTSTEGAPFEEAAGAITYQGNSEGRARQVGDDLRLDVSLPGNRVLDTGEGFTVTEALNEMIAAARSGDGAQLEAALERVETARGHLAGLGAEAGGTATRLDQAEGQLRQASLLVEGRRSTLEDADLAETYMRFQQVQTGVQAALKVTAATLQTSLLDYLR